MAAKGVDWKFWKWQDRMEWIIGQSKAIESREREEEESKVSSLYGYRAGLALTAL